MLLVPDDGKGVENVLKEMVEDGLVTKTIFPELPPRSEYHITELGKSLLPIIDAMLKWGEDHFDFFEKKYNSSKRHTV